MGDEGEWWGNSMEEGEVWVRVGGDVEDWGICIGKG